MSVADTLYDAVSELDEYLDDGGGEAWPGQDYHAELLDTRDRMERLRCKIDAKSMGVEWVGAHNVRSRKLL
jgi:hypothetical protein